MPDAELVGFSKQPAFRFNRSRRCWPASKSNGGIAKRALRAEQLPEDSPELEQRCGPTKKIGRISDQEVCQHVAICVAAWPPNLHGIHHHPIHSLCIVQAKVENMSMARRSAWHMWPKSARWRLHSIQAHKLESESENRSVDCDAPLVFSTHAPQPFWT